MKTEVIIDFDIEGIHRWPDAPSQVSFLQHPHRHLFRIRAAFVVSQEDREIEIFEGTWLFKTYLIHKYGKPCQFDNMSCETISRILLEYFEAEWVEVLEDGRGGARVQK